MDGSDYKVRDLGYGRVFCEFTFTAPGAGTSVTVSTGVDGSNEVATITHVAGTAILVVTLKNKWNKVLHAGASILSTTGKRATIDTIANEGSGTSAISFNLRTWVAAGTVDNDNADRITVQLALRNGYAGVK